MLMTLTLAFIRSIRIPLLKINIFKVTLLPVDFRDGFSLTVWQQGGIKS